MPHVRTGKQYTAVHAHYQAQSCESWANEAAKPANEAAKPANVKAICCCKQCSACTSSWHIYRAPQVGKSLASLASKKRVAVPADLVTVRPTPNPQVWSNIKTNTHTHTGPHTHGHKHNLCRTCKVQHGHSSSHSYGARLWAGTHLSAPASPITD